MRRFFKLAFSALAAMILMVGCGNKSLDDSSLLLFTNQNLIENGKITISVDEELVIEPELKLAEGEAPAFTVEIDGENEFISAAVNENKITVKGIKEGEGKLSVKVKAEGYESLTKNIDFLVEAKKDLPKMNVTVSQSLYNLQLDEEKVVALKNVPEGSKITLETSGPISAELLSDNRIWTKLNAKASGKVIVKIENDGYEDFETEISIKKACVPKPIISTYNKVLERVNYYREAAGAAPLKYKVEIEELAEIRAFEIKDEFSHKRPDGSDWTTVFYDHDVSYVKAAENIAVGSGMKDPEKLVDDWMNSPEHKANILDPDFTAMAVFDYADGEDHWVQLFIAE